VTPELAVALAVAGGLAAIVSVVAAVFGVPFAIGRALSRIQTEQTEHLTRIGKLEAGVVDQGRRLEDLGLRLADFRGRVLGALGDDFSKGHRA
jgi:hypothetical protein